MIAKIYRMPIWCLFQSCLQELGFVVFQLEQTHSWVWRMMPTCTQYTVFKVKEEISAVNHAGACVQWSKQENNSIMDQANYSLQWNELLTVFTARRNCCGYCTSSLLSVMDNFVCKVACIHAKPLYNMDTWKALLRANSPCHLKLQKEDKQSIGYCECSWWSPGHA